MLSVPVIRYLHNSIKLLWRNLQRLSTKRSRFWNLLFTIYQNLSTSVNTGNKHPFFLLILHIVKLSLKSRLKLYFLISAPHYKNTPWDSCLNSFSPCLHFQWFCLTDFRHIFMFVDLLKSVLDFLLPKPVLYSHL